MSLKATGIVRRVDELGRIVIPKSIRDTHGIDEGTPLEVFTDDKGSITLRTYQPGCKNCGKVTDQLFGEVKICAECATRLHTNATTTII
ncbi:Stage V sporulation protein T [compost metagenome]